MGTAATELQLAPRKLEVVWTDHDGLGALTRVALALPVAAALLSFSGVPKIPLMWPMYQFGIVAPTCGLTRGVVALARGDVGRAWAFNPATFLVAAAVLGLLARAVVGWRSGRWFLLRWRDRRPVWVAAITLVAVLWANQQLHADFVIHQLR